MSQPMPNSMPGTAPSSSVSVSAPAGPDAHGAGDDVLVVRMVRRRGGLLDWFAEHPYVGVAAFVHAVFIIAIYTLVVKQVDAPTKDPVIEIGIGFESSDGPDKPEDVEQGGGGPPTPFPHPQPIPGLKNDADAKANEAAMARTPELPPVTTPTETGAPPTLSPIHSNAMGQLLTGEGVPGSGASGEGASAGGGYGLRSEAGRGIGVRNNGGSAESEAAVDAGLRWLAAHQTREQEYIHSLGRTVPIGYWHPTDFSRSARDLRTMEPVRERLGSSGATTQEFKIGLTGLVTLAFLGAGHKPGEGEYGDEVGRAVRWLVLQQDAFGVFGRANMYNHSIATLALCEAMQATGDQSLRPTIEKAVKHMLKLQYEDGGWDYSPNFTARNDTSINSWCMIALKSAKAQGIVVERTTFLRIIHHFKRMTTADGFTIYADRTKEDYRVGTAMVATSQFCRLSLGAMRDDAMVARQGKIMLDHLPDSTDLNSLDNSYYSWYLGTLASFFQGGEQWLRWNSVVRPLAVRLQRRDGQYRGSWDPVDKWSWAGGRIYSTAIMVLMLEVYYRYVPEYFIADAQQYVPFWDDARLYAVLGDTLRGRRAFDGYRGE